MISQSWFENFFIGYYCHTHTQTSTPINFPILLHLHSALNPPQGFFFVHKFSNFTPQRGIEVDRLPNSMAVVIVMSGLWARPKLQWHLRSGGDIIHTVDRDKSWPIFLRKSHSKSVKTYLSHCISQSKSIKTYPGHCISHRNRSRLDWVERGIV